MELEEQRGRAPSSQAQEDWQGKQMVSLKGSGVGSRQEEEQQQR